MGYEPLHHKYRPQTFAALVGQEAIATTLSNAMVRERIAPAYLFTGPRGTGKTSSARILAKSLNCISGDKPTPNPCGQCDICQAIAKGSALDVIEIDAASNTGVDNIREIIERAQFSPVQCRYKIYVIDECLTGNSLIQTDVGLMRIDDPHLLGQNVLSYNENQKKWEYKKVIRWLKQGRKQTLNIKTNQGNIQCTENHLIRTERGWIAAKDLTIGMKILSPVNAGVEHSSKSMELIAGSTDLFEGISLKAINSDKKATILPLYWSKLNPSDHFVPVDVVKGWQFQHLCKKKALVFEESKPIGKNIPIRKPMEYGIYAPKNYWGESKNYPQRNWDLSMEPSWETLASPNQIPTVDFLDWHGLTAKNNENGHSTNLTACLSLAPRSIAESTKDMETIPSSAIPFVIRNYAMFLTPLNLITKLKLSLLAGSIKSHPRELLGGIWMMVLLSLVLREVLTFNFIQKDTLNPKISSLPIGSRNKDIVLRSDNTIRFLPIENTITSPSRLKVLENSLTTFVNIQSLQWITNLATVEFVNPAGVEDVFDLEVEDNHNFVANGLLVHNCHMLSAAAFNALLKTLEEPPDRVVFVLATTDPQRVLPTIISRCQRFDYRRIPLEAMVSHLRYIADQEAIEIEAEALTLVGQMANGGLRDAESLLDQLSLLAGIITPAKVWDLVGAVPEQDLLSLLMAIASDDPEALLDSGRQILNRGREPLVVLQNLAGFYLNLLIAKTAPQREDLVAVTASTWQNLLDLAQTWTIAAILQGQQRLKDAEIQIRNTTQPRLWLEVTLLGLLPSNISITSAPVAVSISPALKPEPKLAIATATIAQPPEIIEKIPPTFRSAQPDAPVIPPPSPVSPTKPLADIWASILEQLPMAAKTLLRIHGSLGELDNHRAQILMKTAPLLAIANHALPEIEAAFQKICQRPIKVKFEVASTTSASPSPISAPPPPPRETESPKPVIEPVKPAQIPKPLPSTPPKSQTAVSPNTQGKEAPAVDSGDQAPSTPSSKNLLKAMEMLAKSFEGEIIHLEDEPSTPIPVSGEEAKPLVKGRPAPADVIDDDDDLPF